jgi:hypothetical protein
MVVIYRYQVALDLWRRYGCAGHFQGGGVG